MLTMPKIPLKRDPDGGGLRPDGMYRLRVEDVEAKEGKSGHPYLNLRFSVLVRGQPQGMSVWDILSFSPAARFKFDQILDALNAPEDGEVSAMWLKGKLVWAMLKTEEYNGKFSNKVGQYITADVAEQQMALLDSEEDEDEEDEEDEEEGFVAPVKQARKAPAAKTKTRVAELDDEGSDEPF